MALRILKIKAHTNIINRSKEPPTSRPWCRFFFFLAGYTARENNRDENKTKGWQGLERERARGREGGGSRQDGKATAEA